MTKIDIFSGFLGAGKTTLIKKLIKEAYKDEKLVLIENEFGEIGIDGGFMQEAGVNVNEMNSGCICCSLVGDFAEALKKVFEEYSPDRILIEPSGVGKLSDVIKAVNDAHLHDLELNSFCAVVDAKKCKMYMKNFGEFFNNQIENASCIILSHTDTSSTEKLEECISLIRQHNTESQIITTDWNKIEGNAILSAMENSHTLESELNDMKNSEGICHHCGHHHHTVDECHHEHHHDEHCECHHEHHHHHADDVFTSWGKETVRKYSNAELYNMLSKLDDESLYGTILRAKGIVESDDGSWVHFDYIPGEIDIRSGTASTIGRICVIGSNINEEKLAELFNLK